TVGSACPCPHQVPGPCAVRRAGRSPFSMNWGRGGMGVVYRAQPGLDTGSLHAPAGYAILDELGRGGMGVVYRARQTALGREVALKMILAGGHAGEAELARFRSDAEALARLQHPGIVQIFEVVEHGGHPFISLEYCAGGSLEKQLGGTPLPPARAAEIIDQIAR